MKIEVNKKWHDCSPTSSTPLSSGVETIYASGFEIEDGMAFLKGRRAPYDVSKLRTRMHDTAVESFVNSFHLDSYGQELTDFTTICQLLRLIGKKVDELPRYWPIKVVFSGFPGDVVCKIYSVREELPFLSEDIELYVEPILCVEFVSGA